MGMIRLWHPMRDPYHCSFRMLSLLYADKTNTIPLAKLSFFDLFFLFPIYLRILRLPSDASVRRRGLKLPRNKDTFVHMPDIRLVYRELQQYQKVALDRLVGQGILSKGEYGSQIVKLSKNSVPLELSEHINDRSDGKQDLLSLIVDDVGRLPVDGPNGLLRQTRLELGGRLH